MIKNRDKVEKFILASISKIILNADILKKNIKLYNRLFRSMSDDQFDAFMRTIRDRGMSFPIIVPNTAVGAIDPANNIKIAKEFGYEFFQHLKITNNKDMIDYITPNKYLVLSLPVRRTAQLLTKKISIPKDTKSMDLSTGQVTNKSKGSKLTMPEVQILSGMGLKESIKELMKDRGGDIGSKNAMEAYLVKQGSVSDSQLEPHSTGVVSTKTLSSYLKAMHIKNNL